jgi:tetratricopeptide (TPR) repeat protein/O-antigen ligase
VSASRLAISSEPRFHHALRWVLAATSLAIPFVFLGALADPFQLPKQLVFRWAAITFLGFWLAGTWSSGRIVLRKSAVAAPVFLLVFIGMLSVFQAANAAEASSAVRDAVLACLILFLSLPVLERRDRLVGSCLGVSAVATAALGTLQLTVGPGMVLLPPTQGGALVGDVTVASIFVGAVLPLLFGLTAAPGWSGRTWIAGAAVATAFVALSRTPAAWLGALVGLGVLAAASFRRSPGSARPLRGPGRSWVAAAGIAALLVLSVSWTRGFSLLSSPPSLKIAELQGPVLRLETWRATTQIILRHPLGIGAGSWRRVFPQEAGALTPRSPFTSSRWPQSAGNEFLEIGSELGGPGFFLLLWLVIRLLDSGWKNRQEGGTRAGALASLAGLGGCALLSSPLREQPILWSATILAALATAPRGGSSDPARPIFSVQMEPRRRRTLGFVAALLFAALVALSGWDTYRVAASSAALQSGQAACVQRDYARAIPALRRATRRDPTSSLARYLTGVCSLDSGRADLAEPELRTAIDLNPYDASALLALGSAYRSQGKLTDALGAMERAKNVWPTDEEVNLALGDARGALGDVPGAAQAYRTALASNPHSVQGYLKLGSLMETHGKVAGAVSAFSSAADLDPYRPEALSRLGGAYLKQGDYEAAVQVYQGLLSFLPDDVSALTNLARTYVGMQRPCDAMEKLESARDLERDPRRRGALENALAEVSSKCRNAPSGGR